MTPFIVARLAIDPLGPAWLDTADGFGFGWSDRTTVNFPVTFHGHAS